MKAEIVVALLLAPVLAADTGVLLPTGAQQPDPAVFSLDEMAVTIRIDNGDAKVSVRQIFGSHTGRVLEGTYLFALPGRAAVSDFAVWDGLVRIPGVILERKRAGEIYERLASQAIDPGLLQQGERTAEEASRSAVFSANIVPIPAYGTKRIEIEYHQAVPVENLASLITLPMRPDAYRTQTAGRLRIDFELRSAYPIASFAVTSKTMPLRLAERGPNLVRGSFEGTNVNLTEDFAAGWNLRPVSSPRMRVDAYRNPAEAPNGYFEGMALLPPTAASASPRTVVALFDASLSMQWEKLERSYQALDALLHSLRPVDHFNVLVFNSRVHACLAAPQPFEIRRVENALGCVRAEDLRGGTNLEAALAAALAQPPSAGTEPYLVLISDAGATEGAIRNSRVAAAYRAAWNRLAPGRRPRTYIFAVGDDADQPLARMLAEQDGIYEWVRSTEPLDFKLKGFLSKIGRRPVDLKLTASPPANFDMVYPVEDRFFTGSVPSWVGQYRKPGPAVFSTGTMKEQVALPAQALEHDQLPRTWAQARVNALLDKIQRRGEDRPSIEEIIRLSRKYKFVTPYTSFLAAPRALLRPRVIRPGDPVLRVHTDPSIVSVVALFPFGLVKSLRHLAQEDVWQTRFLAPPDMADGTYSVRLVLRDREGHVYRESKSFVIASKPPTVRIRLASQRARAGETVHLRVQASATTQTITARLYGAGPVWLRWNPGEAANTGDLVIPPHLPPGRYPVEVTAEDVAHNIGTGEVALEVVP